MCPASKDGGCHAAAGDEAPAGDAAAGEAFHMHHWQGALAASEAAQGALSAIHDRLPQVRDHHVYFTGQ